MGTREPLPHLTGSSRLSIPAAGGLRRPRLLDTLDSLFDARLCVVVGRAGTGKTSAMADWARRAPADIAWCQGREAGVPRPTVSWLARALARAVPAAASAEDLDGLAACLDAHPSPVVLVVDDLHLVRDGNAEELLQQLLFVAPPHLHVLIGSRRMPEFNLARTELALAVVTEDDLRFRRWEVQQLFRDVYRTPVSSDEASLLTRRTQGWAAALHLFHLSTIGRSHAEQRHAVRSIDGRVRYARDYLTRQVLAGLPDEAHDFLRRTCVFETLTPSRCDALLDTTTSQQLLLDLERRHALTSSDDGGLTFRTHVVLRDHLTTQLCEDLGDLGARAWYEQAAEVLEHDDAIPEALNARLRCQDWAAVRRLVRKHGSRLATTESTAWAGLVPQWLADEEPWAALAVARRELDEGRLASAEQTARGAERRMVGAEGLAACRKIVRIAAAWRGDPDQWQQWGGVVLSATRGRPAAAAREASLVTGPQGGLLRGLSSLLAGDVQQAERVLNTCAYGTDADIRTMLAARLALAAFHDDGGSAADAVATDAERHGLTWLSRIACGVSRAHRVAAGAPGEDAELGDDVLAAQQRGDAWGAAVLVGARCVAQLRSGCPDPTALDDLAMRFRALGATTLEAWARAGFALATATAELPDAGRDALAAESLARAADVPGALAVAYAALGAASPGQREEFLSLAESSADAAGLSVRPWHWLSRCDAAESPPSSTAPPTALTRDRTPVLTVRCFGGFEIHVDGRPPDLKRIRPRARTLLRLLAMRSGQPVHRELLLDALWRELDWVAGTHNLHVSVSSLRALLEPGVPRGTHRLLVRDGDRYQLVLAEGASSDLRDFDAAVAEGDSARGAGDTDAAVRALGRALDLYVGELLPADAAAEWVVGVRDSYRARVAEAAGSLAELHIARNDPSAAVAAALRSLDADPWRDASWRLLITGYHAAGDPAAAEQARRSYADVLASLGVGADYSAAALPRGRRPSPP